MAKKNTQSRKPSGAAGISTISEDLDQINAETPHEFDSVESDLATAPKRTAKAKPEQPSSEGNFGVSEIKKAAAFVNSVGGLDKAMTLLQILKVAKEVI